MKIAALNDNIHDAIVARPVYDENMMLLVNVGAKLDEPLIDRLKSRGYKYVYVQEEGTEAVTVTENFSVEAGREVAASVKNTFQGVQSFSTGDSTTLKAVFSRLPLENRFKDLMPKGDFRKKVVKLVTDIYYRNVPTVNSYSLSMLGTSPLSHAMDITILSVILGKRFSYSVKELASLATASLLHDTGLQLFPDIAEKPVFMLSERERAQYNDHPSIGYKLLDSLNCFPLVEMQTVLQHHENQDGSGFPYGYKGRNEKPLKVRQSERGYIFRWAEILAVADRYVLYCSGNLTPTPMTPAETIAAIIEESDKVLNATIVAELVKLINIFPVGVPIKIIDSVNQDFIGYEGIVIEENHQRMDLPVVLLLKSRKGQKLSPIRLDLSKDKEARLALAV